jgi:hypothetical protein
MKYDNIRTSDGKQCNDCGKKVADSNKGGLCQSCAKKGTRNKMYGVRTAKTANCIVCGNEFMCRWGKPNKYCCHGCYWKDMRNRRGEDTSAWKGRRDYMAVHKWISKNWIKTKCEFCGDNTNKLQWANISGEYYRTEGDWLCLCQSCHMRWDRVAYKIWRVRKKIPQRFIQIDCDGVIHNNKLGYLNGEMYGKPSRGAVFTIQNLLNAGYEVSILTARQPKEFKKVAIWLHKYKFPGMRITNIKRPALCYVDDKAIRFVSFRDLAKYYL